MIAVCGACSFEVSSPTASVDATLHEQLTGHHPVTVTNGPKPPPLERWVKAAGKTEEDR